MPFEFFPLENCAEVVRIRSKRFVDDRGWFLESFKSSDFRRAGIDIRIAQENLSFSRRGVLRGIHLQQGTDAQGKLVQCLAGEILDVAVDLRLGSTTFGRHDAVRLSQDDPELLWIPPGFGHGFQVTSENALVRYFGTTEYAPSAERTVRWNDTELGIRWPISEAILNVRDAKAPDLAELRAAL